jgi:hypothetical protein
VYDTGDRVALVDSSPIWISGEQGSWDTTMSLLINMLTPEQMKYFIYGLGFARASITQHIHVPGQALVLAGPAGSGKSLTQDLIITPFLGGRSGNPFPLLIRADWIQQRVARVQAFGNCGSDKPYGLSFQEGVWREN